MTDAMEDLELFDEAKQEFPGKEDLRDRLVAIWLTGKHGTRKGADSDYDWYETITLVLDDPNGTQDWDERTKVDGDYRETLVKSVVKHGPQRLDSFQYSQTGLTARMKPRLNMKDDNDIPVYRPMIGRINERKSTQKGRSNPWSIATPTDDDKATARKYADRIRAITMEVKALREGSGSDDSAFD